MTLHEAIEQVLQINGKPMFTSEIAEIINNNKLYVRRDDLPIKATQIAARIGNYPNLFSRDSGKINLIKNDTATLLFQKFRNEFVHNFNKINNSKNLIPLEILKKGINELLDKNDEPNLLKEPSSNYGQNNTKDEAKLEAIFKLCHWYLLQESNSRRNSYHILNEGFIDLIAGLDWFREHNNTVITDTTLIEYFIFKIIKENKNAVFKIESNRNQEFLPEDVIKFNKFLIEINHDYFKGSSQINYKNLKTEIIIPPLGFRSSDTYPIEFNEIINEILTKKKKIDKAILLVSIGTLIASTKRHLEARKIIVESNYLETIVELPSGVIENTGVKMALLLFDFKRTSSDKLFFINTSNLQLSDLYNVSKTINNKSIIDDYSIEVKVENIVNNNYNLIPAGYINKVTDIEIKEGYKLFTLGEILIDQKRGSNLNSKKNNFYSGGEYKLLRNSDLNTNSIYYNLNQDAIGIDHDQLKIEKLNLVKGGVALSAINQNVKANVLPDNGKFVIGNYIHWLNPNLKIVSSEYLAKELLKPYVLKQFNLFTSGSSYVPLLRLNDLLNVQLQIPSLAIQSELLLSEFRNTNIKERNSETISERELDFIKTLKHSLKQPTAGLSNDFASLKYFLNGKIKNLQTITTEESIVPIFEDDSLETIERYSLKSTLARMERSLTDIDYILEQAITIITIANPNKKEIDLKSVLTQITTEYPNISIKVIGGKTNILADENQLNIVLRNLIDNAIKHGFIDKDIEPIVWLEILKKGTDFVDLSVRNNGNSLPPEFTIDDFLAKGKSSRADVGSGFGGFLIGQIIKNHKGKIELNNNVGNEILPHNVEFIISLPR